MDSSIVVQWHSVNNFLPTNYTVTWNGNRTNSVQSHTLTKQSSYTITGLTLDTVYTITVTAANRCGTGPEYRTNVSFYTGITFSVYGSPTYLATVIIIKYLGN